MGKQRLPQSNLDKTRTKEAVNDALNELHHAARPKVRNLGEGVVLLMALGAGAFTALRSFRAGQKAETLDLTAPTVDAALNRLPGKTGLPIEARSAVPKADDKAETVKPAVVEGGIKGLGKEFLQRFNDDEVMTRSYALSFILVLSLVPLLLFALAIAGFFIHSPGEAEGYVRKLIGGLLPGEQAGQAANQFIEQTHIAQSAQTLMNGKWYALVFGILSLLWAAIGLFLSAADPMNKAWDVKETRSFIKLRLVALGNFIATIVFFALSLLLTSGAHGALASLGVPDNLAIVVDLIFFVLAVAVNAGMFTLIYWWLPNTTVTLKSALFGGAIAGLLFEVFKQGFAMYLAHFGNFNKVYGAFGGVFLLVTWISYSCVLLLGGAILCKMYHEHSEQNGVTQRAK